MLDFELNNILIFFFCDGQFHIYSSLRIDPSKVVIKYPDARMDEFQIILPLDIIALTKESHESHRH